MCITWWHCEIATEHRVNSQSEHIHSTDIWTKATTINRWKVTKNFIIYRSSTALHHSVSIMICMLEKKVLSTEIWILDQRINSDDIIDIVCRWNQDADTGVLIVVWQNRNPTQSWVEHTHWDNHMCDLLNLDVEWHNLAASAIGPEVHHPRLTSPHDNTQLLAEKKGSKTVFTNTQLHF